MLETKLSCAGLQHQEPISPEGVESKQARIPVHSRQHAMDWSLVLISQGIETIIEPPRDGEGWALLVPAQDSQRALKSLRQYRLENRDWPWRQQLRWPETPFDWGAAVWAVVLIVFHWVGSVDTHWVNAGIMDSAKVASGQWWRVITAMTLHADVAHLAENLSIGVVLLGLAMGRFGTGIGLLAALLAGVGGNLASLLLNEKPFEGLGASGMIMGALGLLAAQTLRSEAVHSRSRKETLAGVAAGVMLFVLFGVTPGSDMAAHLGGFVSGLALGAALVFCPQRLRQNAKLDLAALILFVALLTASWQLALFHHARLP